VVLFVRKAATPETQVTVSTLAEADPALADMRTLVMIGATATRLIPRTGQRPWVYTPRAEPGTAR
jgi:precorrin-3B C17-methyltransferase